MKALVTGGAGWIGQATCLALKDSGYEPVVFDRSTDGDVVDLSAVMEAMAGSDAVINLAGVLGTAETVGEEHVAAEVNILGALNVYEAARHHDVPVVQIGTGHRGQPNPYAITKACAEDLGLARARWSRQPITVVRAYHAWGPGQKMCPPHGTSPVRKIVPSFIARALTGMPLEVWGDGDQLIDLVHVDDVAAALVGAISLPAGSVVEAGTGVATTVERAALDVMVATGSASRIVHRPMRTGEPPGCKVVAPASIAACPNRWGTDSSALSDTIDWYRQELGL